jgi:hypothetical protein
MSLKRESNPSRIAGVLEKLTEKGYAVNFDFTVEFNMPQLRMGSIRIHGTVESSASRKK